MANHFAKLTEAKKEFKNRTGMDYSITETHHSGLRIHHRNKNRKKGNKLKRGYFLGSYMEWLNL